MLLYAYSSLALGSVVSTVTDACEKNRATKTSRKKEGGKKKRKRKEKREEKETGGSAAICHRSASRGWYEGGTRVVP